MVLSSTYQKAPRSLRIFLSYGHDRNEALVQRIKADLQQRGHDVWFDKSRIKAGQDWRRAITDGIMRSHRVIFFLSKHSVRDPGVCLDEIGLAIGVKGSDILTVLVESEKEAHPPPSISHIQWLDMRDWQERQDAASWREWYQDKLNEIISAVESDEGQRFSGEIATLAKCLNPISSDSRAKQLLKNELVGRAWLFEAIEQWRTAVDRTSRLFWIKGAPGVGKSAFAAHLAHYSKGKVIAAEFCQYDKLDHRDAKRIVCTLAFQIATRLPDYRKLLLVLRDIRDLGGKEPGELFNYLLADPLCHVIGGGHERFLIVIDALDEAGADGHNELVEMLASNAQFFPDWIGIVVTSRPESHVVAPLQGLNPVVLDTTSESNRADIRNYVQRELAPILRGRPDSAYLVEQIIDQSEGVFLYAERFCAEVRDGRISLDRPAQFPPGLGGIYYQYFRRQFPDLETYRETVRPALRVILAAPVPLPVVILKVLFGWAKEELYDFTRPLASLLPVMTEDDTEAIRPYHKSLADWLADDDRAGQYYVSVEAGHRALAEYGWKEFLRCADHPRNMNRYFLNHLVGHLRAVQETEKLAKIMADFPSVIDRYRRGEVEHIENRLDWLPMELRRETPLQFSIGMAGCCIRTLMALVPSERLATAPAAELAQALSRTRWEHKASTYDDDDEYWMARSPIDSKFYVFASTAAGGGWPTRPCYVYSDRPDWFNED